jgi:hypothetical protein
MFGTLLKVRLCVFICVSVKIILLVNTLRNIALTIFN